MEAQDGRDLRTQSRLVAGRRVGFFFCAGCVSSVRRKRMLLRTLLELLGAWRPAFHQDRSYRRAAAQALGTLASFGRRTLSRAIWALGHQHQDWSAEYRLHARSDWKPGRLFQPVVEH